MIFIRLKAYMSSFVIWSWYVSVPSLGGLCWGSPLPKDCMVCHTSRNFLWAFPSALWNACISFIYLCFSKIIIWNCPMHHVNRFLNKIRTSVSETMFESNFLSKFMVLVKCWELWCFFSFLESVRCWSFLCIIPGHSYSPISEEIWELTEFIRCNEVFIW